MTQLEIETRLQNPEDSTDGAWSLQAGTEEAQRFRARTERGQCIGVSLGGQNLVTGRASVVTGWASAHPVNMLAEALRLCHALQSGFRYIGLTCVRTNLHLDKSLSIENRIRGRFVGVGVGVRVGVGVGVGCKGAHKGAHGPVPPPIRGKNRKNLIKVK